MNSNQPANSLTAGLKSFRQDINGLRAWAVVAVVLYHFGVPGFSGGYIGVDVFFVISGFLMSGIIIRGLERGSFSLWDFYFARARRIVPALVVLCALLLLFSWFLLPSVDYKTLGIHVATALVFVSNIKFWREAGYFDAASHEKWLLHTWSLSVEWQFYILLPLGCMLIWRCFGRVGVKVALITVFLLSLIFSLYASHKYPELSFYLLPTRAWEMLAGGFVWWITRKPSFILSRLSYLSEVTGLLLITVSIFLFDADLAWPGFFALVPVVGTMLVLCAKRQESIFTVNPIANWLGTCSYSIYLWHWPLVVIMNYYGKQGDVHCILLGLLFTLIFGFASYCWVENISRVKLSLLAKSKELLLISIPVSCLLAASIFVYFSGGANYDWRLGAVSVASRFIDKYSVDNYLTPYLKQQYKLDCDFFDSEKYAAKNDIPALCTQSINGDGVFLWGDSHAQALSYGIRKHLRPQFDFYQIASSGCQPHIGADASSNGQIKVACDKSNDKAISEISRLKPGLVIMAQHYDHDKNDYDKIINYLISAGVKKIIILGPVPQWRPSLPRTIAFRHIDIHEKEFNDSSFDRKLFDIDNNMKRKFSRLDHVVYISLLDQLCVRDVCIAKVDDFNTPLVWDYGHLSLPGSDFVIRKVLSENSILNSYLE